MMTLSVKRDHDRWRFSGPFDKTSIPVFLAQKRDLFKGDEGSGVCRIDLTDVTQIDSSGLAYCIELLKTSQNCNIPLEIYHPPGRLCALMKAQGVDILLSEVMKGDE
jgi:ABC-type transporter Mla MlaB component